MKITYFYRSKRAGLFSIEELFQLLRRYLGNRIVDSEFYVNKDDSAFLSIKKAKKKQGDINHITGAINYLALGLVAKKTIITVHDIGHFEKTLTGIKKIVYKYFWLKWPLNRVAAITTISQFTKSRILYHFNIAPEKVHVIYNPAPLDFNYIPREFSKTPRILQIGSGHNKNIEGLIDAAEGISCTLILVRKPDEKIKQKLEEKNINYEFHFDLERKEIIKIYQSSDILFFASHYEGFGVPILEANSTGVPVITGNVASMPEIAGEAAAIVDPLSSSEIRSSILKIIEDSNYRNDLIAKGFKNLERFSPEKIASSYYDLYKKLMN